MFFNFTELLKVCPVCLREGWAMNPFFLTVTPCPFCYGNGYIVDITDFNSALSKSEIYRAAEIRASHYFGWA